MPCPRPVLPRRSAALLALALMAGQPVLAQNAPPPTPVTVVTLNAGDVTLSSPLPGRVAASAEAEVRPQVGGIIQKRLFDEGSTVSEGDPLYQIDAATYEAVKAVAEASLAQAKAALKSAEIEYERQQELKSRNVVAQQNLDSAIAARDSALAAVKVAEANLLSAEIDLERTQIRAPISGAVGLSAVSQGALVTSGQSTALTTIRALDPVYVDVTQAASEMLRWRRMGNGAEFSETLGQTVSLTLADGSSYEYKGELSAAEPYVNEDTGTIVLRLSFPNPDHFLLPGMYVQVEMPQGVVPGAVLVPQEAVTRDRRGRPMALVVNGENVVESRVLDVVSDQGNNWIVTGGVAEGERVIVAGLQKTAAGATVAPQEQGAEAPAAQDAQPSE
ncbi:efflux RND transporter periplasmic adaptor subunit [Celeribacter ethanolicus]|uniref:Efflux RND transporter periplasmic adaptor subunit n=1 Tax=Celeribacter ethanolicus TaxID=1758178 RepID=A0A291G7E7_9RHOB|nr:efflux RND transporter periplasmic adaptor subunit [Celeribacter ethanolicus]TNE65056.1 MAG: efflux RND transporter periplasmic adaptor subunit [Paracoccaceae bacterium]